MFLWLNDENNGVGHLFRKVPLELQVVTVLPVGCGAWDAVSW